MKSRKTIGLALLVLGIWGTIGYKIYQGMDDDTAPVIPRPVKKVAYTSESKENFPLELNYRDPFFKNKITSQKSEPVKKPSRKIIQPAAGVPNIIINWNNIEYMGSMYNASRKVVMASLRMDGVDYMGKQGEVVNDFRIVTILPDSVQLSFGAQSKYIIKKK